MHRFDKGRSGEDIPRLQESWTDEHVQYEQALELLPVLDLMGGVVVRARAGERACYAPIESPLAAGSAPATLLAALLERSGAHAAYLADLDAIMHGKPQTGLVRELLSSFPEVSLWLDGGFCSLDDGLAMAAQLGEAGTRRRAGQAAARAARLLPVLGSESLQACSDLSRGRAAGACVLSLDFGPEGFRGDPDWLARPALWPRQVIVMTLARVGMAQGPDLQRLEDCRRRAGTRRVYAAGGVRGPQDIRALEALGIAGALVATALHASALPAA